MKITEQFDDIAEDTIPIEKLRPGVRRGIRTVLKHGASRKVTRKHWARPQPSLPRFKCLEDA